MQKRKLIVMGFMLALSLTLSAQTNMIDGVVWIVGDNAIMRSEVEEQRLRLQYEGQRLQGDPYCVIPERMALQKLYLHQAKIDSLEAGASQVEAQVNMRMDHFMREIGSKEKVEEYFKKTVTEIKDEMRQMIHDQLTIQMVQQKLTGDIKLTPAEVRAFYQSLPDDSIPMIPAMVEVQIITLEPPIPVEDLEATKNRLREYAERVNNGSADFSMLARLYSDDPGTASKGGELGFFGRGTMVPEFTNAAFALTEPGQVSRVFQTEFGFHIVQLLEKRGDRINCRHILLRPRVSAAIKEKTFQQLDSLAALIRTGKMTFEEAAIMNSSDKNTRMNGGVMTNENTGASKFEYQDLPQEVAKIAYNLKIGEISQPFAMMDASLGREVYAVIRLKAKTPNHKANLNDDYQQLKQYCENVKRAEILSDWIDRKIKETYIYIAPDWRNCDFEHEGWLKK
ncbi:MAG: peptidylprolyl isomerase [Paludibacteraceae bacterium]